ncbi:Mitogen-activated protein kinase kinase 9 [Zea mays]|uniref:Mitogen-activated protein kinase kinase 9 n=1 Tax=Zea mays TaxID=4577 RepID=A0A1D6N571_MAIZE|nr:Mitogen-activated protein kinase kinase 9 [Zea mays]
MNTTELSSTSMSMHQHHHVKNSGSNATSHNQDAIISGSHAAPSAPAIKLRLFHSASDGHPDAAASRDVPAEAPAPAAPEKLRLSDLEWICNLGAGGLASVCKARHCRTGEVFAFAVKISFDQDPLVLENEAEVLKIAARATHVIDFYALLREPGYNAALVLEYMDTGSLGSLLRRRRRRGLRIPEAAVAEVAMQCVEGLLQLHYRGVAHLDVKPDNILANSRGEIKMGDFNISRVLYVGSGELLEVPITGGTKMYFSPERFAPNARAGPIGAMKADVWGLGVTIVELF